jgi:glucose-1-phosphate cytidylyltransferase
MDNVTAVILCGGKGERLRPYTESLPKPMIPLNGIPLLEHLLRYLSASGIRKFVLCVGHKAEVIKEFAENYQSPHEIVCVDSGDASMTDRILEARPHVDGRALVCYGDTLANVDIGDLCLRHRLHGALATLTVYPMYSPFGVVEVKASGQVSGFREKPRLPYWINIGFLLCEPGALDQLRRNSDIPEFLETLKEQGSLFAYQHSGRHLTVNNEKERQSAESDVAEFFTVIDTQALSRPESPMKVRGQGASRDARPANYGKTEHLG